MPKFTLDCPYKRSRPFNRVVIASYTFLPDIGGVASTEAELAQAFSEQGYDVTVVTLTKSDTSLEFPYRVIRRPNPFRLFAIYVGADLLIESNLALRLVYPLIFYRRRFALRHHSESANALSRSYLSSDVIKRWVMRRATHFMTSNYCGVRSGMKFHVTHPFPCSSDLSGSFCRAPGRRKGILFVGRLVEEKGILFFLDRLRLFCDELGEEYVKIVGAGPLTQRVESQLALETKYDVSFVPGTDLAGVAAAMGECCYCVVPSLWNEPFGAVALEAISMGVIVLHTGRGGLSEATGELGFQFDPDDDRSLREALHSAKIFKNHVYSSGAEWSVFRKATLDWSERFQPSRVVDTIVHAMSIN